MSSHARPNLDMHSHRAILRSLNGGVIPKARLSVGVSNDGRQQRPLATVSVSNDNRHGPLAAVAIPDLGTV